LNITLWYRDVLHIKGVGRLVGQSCLAICKRGIYLGEVVRRGYIVGEWYKEGDRLRQNQIGGLESGRDAIGPLSQGYSGIFTNPRQHARFCYLALHRGEWVGKRIVPSTYYDFA
jgi:hypothetical protein